MELWCAPLLVCAPVVYVWSMRICVINICDIYGIYVLRCHTPDSQSRRERRVTCHEKEVRGERLVRGRRGAGGGARAGGGRGDIGDVADAEEDAKTRNYAKAQPQRAHQEGLYGYGRARGPTHED